MTFSENLQVIERIDNLIQMKVTESASSYRLRKFIEVMKNKVAAIDYCKTKRNYYYKVNKVII